MVQVPVPVEARQNCLVMSFIGSQDGTAAPRLKDVKFNASMESRREKEQEQAKEIE